MGKIFMIAVLSASFVRMVDSYFYYGRNTDAVLSMTQHILRSFGL